MLEANPLDPDRVVARDLLERKLSRIGIPKRLWKPDLKRLRFKAVAYGNEQVSTTAQRQWVQSLIVDPPRRPPFVVISSSPTDNGALYLAHFMVQRTMALGKSAAILDVAEGMPGKFESFPAVVMMHNVLHNATAERTQALRDMTMRFDRSFRIVVVVAEDNPYKWCVNKLGKYPTMVFKTADFVGVV